MKRNKTILSLLLVLVLSVSLLAGCSQPNEKPVSDPVVENPPTDEPAKSGIAKLGIGHIISTAKSKVKADDVNAQAQADVTIAAVGFDVDGKVVSVNIDVAQTRVAFDENMVVASDKEELVQSKKERGEDYGMIKASGIGKEWFEQMEAFENWMIGKTVDEIKALPVKVVDDAHQNVPDAPELTSSVTITVESYIAAVEEAWNKSVDATGAETVGLGIETHINKSKDATTDAGARAQVDTYMAAAAFDADGNVVATIIDNAQVRVDYELDGTLATDTSMAGKTKHELKDDYGMLKASGIGKEWYEQMEAFQEWMVGKDIDEIKGLQVKVVDDSHQNVPDVPELTSSVTITVEGYIAVVEEAAEMAK